MQDARTIPERESLDIEFKSDRGRCDDTTILEACVALANTNGGALYLGVEDNGDVTGVHASHREYLPLSAFIANHTVPPLGVRVDAVEQSEKICLRIDVPKTWGMLYATSSGRALRRRLKADGSPESVPMFPSEIVSHMTNMRAADYSAAVLEEATVDDLDPLEIARLKQIIRDYSGERTLLELTDDELISALGLVETRNGKRYPTIAGLLLIGKRDSLRRFVPTAKSAFQVLSGTNVAMNEDFFVPILAAVERMMMYVDAYNPEEEIDLAKDLYRTGIPAYEKSAVREAVVNAYSHRDYTMLGRVRVMIDERELTVASPGGFVEGIQLTNLLRAEPHGRNLRVSDALKRIGLAERTGRGIDRIFERTIWSGGVLPDYSSSTPAVVSVRIPRAFPASDRFKLVRATERALGRKPSVEMLILACTLGYGQALTQKEAEILTGLPPYEVHEALRAFVEGGLVQQIEPGPEQDARFAVRGNGSGESGQPGAAKEPGVPSNVQISAADRILSLLRSSESLSIAEISEKLTLSRDKAYRALRQLQQDGKADRVGAGRYTRYTAHRARPNN